ncbi:MAG: hypothetical protein ACYTF2_10710 [Planctomycetota bacterium]|jgi:hypothetical protein
MTPPRPLAALLVALALALAAAGPPPAQSGLDPDPLAAEPIGLRMHLPAGAAVLAQVADGTVSYAITGGENSPWSMRIAPLNPAVPEPSPEALLAERIDAVKATGRSHRVIASGPFTSGGVQGRILYLEQTLDDQQQLVNGWLILPTSSRTFLVFAFLTTAEHFPRIRSVLEASFSTIELRSQAELLDERQAQLERGRAIVGTFTPQRLREALGERRWYRLYRPAPPGQPAGITEVGFMNLRCVEAPRGQLTPERSPQSYSGLEAERGLMVLLEARVIIDADNSHYLDLDGRYWLDWDRSSEAWSIRQTRRQGQASKTTAETGVRNLADLEVIHSQKEQFTRDPTRWSVPDTAFLSQPEVLLLGSLLPRDGSVSGGAVFYYYDTRRQQLTQRLDRWAAAGDGTGHWLLTSQPMLDVATITQRFDASGTRVERIDADGTVTRRIDPADLRRLWQSKGLLTR